MTSSDEIKKPPKVTTDAANELVKSQLQLIEIQLKASKKKLGWNSLIYELPTYFPLEGLDKKSGQILIYGLILGDIINIQGHEAKIVLEKDKTLLVIRYEVTPNKNDIDKMKKFIQENSMPISEIENFIKGGKDKR
jgi:hypothetical protein